ncbi:MSHA biogenesis protein MshL [Duganella sp. CF402]|uniref:pilus (MSHA type) biogenesis protein MshL n=1 Tax=unclassified Duganella TaxID=2636909 RepID=UPI0008AECC71|nr:MULTISPECIES: pilus (MSHA type) biogenesis protein MshL [unclassified Duganella]RZT10787.1 MSHA biogenesis protein MshL [Duganella sp. BK701]SEK96552.1 MSHA biogenesis protein MshL [Duganella sp. CF402]
MQKILTIAIATMLLLGGCQTPSTRDTYDKINTEVNAAAAKPSAARQNDAVASALLPPVSQLADQLPKARAVLDERFNVSFNNVPVQQFYNSIVAGTRYNMLINPEVSGNITANLKDVTLFEALDAVREMYGYDYKVEGTRIYIRPLTMQTKMFKINYLVAVRKGASSLRVSSTSVANAGTSNSGNQSSGGNNNNNNNNSGGGNDSDSNNPNSRGTSQRDSANVSTRSESDFWLELKTALEALVETGKDGRSVTISPQSGVIVIRAMPDELRNVDMYLKATQLSVDRQVILEAKILEVELNSNFQSGVNWAAFGKFAAGGNNRFSAGTVQPDTTLGPLGTALSSVGKSGINSSPGSTLGAAADAAGTLFGMAFQTSNFAALISFLEGQGTVHVLSSPRIATLNNQKALLKIGTDEFYVTGVSTTTTTSGTGTGVSSPTVTLQPFFSGVVLDVTPQIDEDGNIILHVHPSVSQVSTVNKGLNLGSLGNFTLPLAASSTSEMDSMVRGQNGQVVAIGGLMRQATTTDRSGVPGASSVPVLGALFGSKSEIIQKRELVVLIKPTVVESSSDWNQDLLDSSRRMKELDPSRGKGRN